MTGSRRGVDGWMRRARGVNEREIEVLTQADILAPL